MPVFQSMIALAPIESTLHSSFGSGCPAGSALFFWKGGPVSVRAVAVGRMEDERPVPCHGLVEIGSGRDPSVSILQDNSLSLTHLRL